MWIVVPCHQRVRRATRWPSDKLLRTIRRRLMHLSWITVNDPMDTRAVNDTFTWDLARRLLPLDLSSWLGHDHCNFNVISLRWTRSVTVWLSVNGNRLADFLQEVVDSSQFSTFGRIFIQRLSCAPAFHRWRFLTRTVSSSAILMTFIFA